MNNIFDLTSSLNVNITADKLLLALGMTAILCVFILVVYRLTYRGAVFTMDFCVSMTLSSMVTCLIILPISSNIALSIGTGGVLSMVRYRTAVKDPKDTAFMFWSIGAGLVCGIGYYLLAAIGTGFIGIVLIILSFVTNIKAKNEPCIAVVKFKGDNLEAVKRLLKCNVKSIAVNEKYTELTAEMKAVPGREVLAKLSANPDIIDMSFVKYNGDYAI